VQHGATAGHGSAAALSTKETALGVALLLTCTGKNTVQNRTGAQTIPAEARFEAPTKVRAFSGSSNPRSYLFWTA